MNLFKGAPDDEAIKMIQYFESLALKYDPRGYCVCTSEGKDSRVLGHLFRRAGVKHFYLEILSGMETAESWFDWWVSDKSYNSEDENQLTLEYLESEGF